MDPTERRGDVRSSMGGSSASVASEDLDAAIEALIAALDDVIATAGDGSRPAAHRADRLVRLARVLPDAVPARP